MDISGFGKYLASCEYVVAEDAAAHGQTDREQDRFPYDKVPMDLERNDKRFHPVRTN